MSFESSAADEASLFEYLANCPDIPVSKGEQSLRYNQLMGHFAIEWERAGILHTIRELHTPQFVDSRPVAYSLFRQPRRVDSGNSYGPESVNDIAIRLNHLVEGYGGQNDYTFATDTFVARVPVEKSKPITSCVYFSAAQADLVASQVEILDAERCAEDGKMPDLAYDLTPPMWVRWARNG